MRLAIFFSGGKDSTYTVFKALKEGYRIEYLFTVVPKNPHSYMFHSVTLEITKIQAKLMNIKQRFFEVSGKKEEEIEELIKKLKEFLDENKIDALGVGSIKSRYQYERFKKIANNLNLALYAPLLNLNCEKYWKELLENKFKIILSKVSALGLDESFLGKIVDESVLKLIIEKSRTYNFDLCFDGGEAETLVLDCPLFSKRIELIDFGIEKDENSSWIKIKRIELRKKKK